MIYRVITVIGVLVTLSACNVANHVRMRYANDNLTVNWPQKVTAITLKTHYIGEKPHVLIDINGETDFLFLIDSGASLTYLMDTPKVAALGLTRGYDLEVGGWGDEQDSPIYQSQVSTLALGEAWFKDVNVAYLPVSKTKYYANPDEAIIDGVLGHDILRHFAWLFDKNDNRIEISMQPLDAHPDDIVIPFEVSFSKLSIPAVVTLNDEQTLEQKILIDTGSRHFFKLNQTYLDEESILLTQRSVAAADFGLSGRALHQRVTLPAITIGELRLDNVKTNLIKTDDSDDFWVIGSAALNQFISILDYHRELLIIRSYPQSTFQSRYNLLGLELRKNRQGNFVVRYVMPDMATADFDFQERDIITRIDGIPSSQMSQDAWLELTNAPGRYEVCRLREVSELERCFIVTSKYIVGYSITEAQTD